MDSEKLPMSILSFKVRKQMKQTFYCFRFLKYMNVCCYCCFITSDPGTVYWEQLESSLFPIDRSRNSLLGTGPSKLFVRINCSLNSKYRTDKKTCCSLYPVPGTLFREQKRCTRPIYYNFAPPPGKLPHSISPG